MNRFYFQKLAITNLKKNKQTYIPYALTGIASLILFYNMVAIAFNPELRNSSLAMLMELGMAITGIFIFIFLLYTNSFLIKRRKKEFGLFNILGMEKKHIGYVMFWETIFQGVTTLIIGLGLGVILNKLFTLLIYKILLFDPNFDFYVSEIALLYSAILFASICFITLLVNLRQVHLANPIELLRGGNVGEKMPKTKWVSALLGLVSLGIGYTIALVLKSPLEAMVGFFVAVIFVIIGTQLLFKAGSIALLKTLKKNKNLYYKTKNFTTISGMIYRMRQNASGLANICILSTAVLVTISTTVCLYLGVEDAIGQQYPRDIYLNKSYDQEGEVDKEYIYNRIDEVMISSGNRASNLLEHSFLIFFANINRDELLVSDSNSFSMSDAMMNVVYFEDLELKEVEEVELGENEVILYNKGMYIPDQFTILDEVYYVKARITQPPVISLEDSFLENVNYMIVANEDELKEVHRKQKEVLQNRSNPIYHHVAFDLDGSDEEKIAVANELQSKADDNFPYVRSKQMSHAEFYELYGSLFFLGIFIGGMFMMATVLIIYYKQVVEGFDDKERFAIMQKVGMSKEEVKKSIRTQVLTIFFLPIIMAIIHIIFAFPILRTLLAMFNLTNVGLFVKCTVGTILVFVAAYIAVYLQTAKVYYKIVEK